MASTKSSLLLLYTFLQGLSAIPLIDFFPFGFDTNDSLVPRVLDGNSGPVTLPQLFPFFSSSSNILFVNTNGVISFNRGFSSFLPVNFPRSFRDMLIAPFWADTDIRTRGNIWYGDRSDNMDAIARAENDIWQYFRSQQDFTPSLVFIVTWDEVPHYLRGNRTNTYQCIMISDGRQSFTIFHYADEMIEWTTGDASGGIDGLGGRQAEIGCDAGDGVNFERVPVSGTPDVINIDSLSNVGVDGVWAFSLSDGDTEDEEMDACDFAFV